MNKYTENNGSQDSKSKGIYKYRNGKVIAFTVLKHANPEFCNV